MTEIDTVPIHHDELDTESWVPAEVVASWAGQGWVPGRLPRLVAEEEAAAELARQEALADEAEPAAAADAAPPQVVEPGPPEPVESAPAGETVDPLKEGLP